MPEETRTLGYLEGQIHGVLREIEVLRGELKEVRNDARLDRAASETRIVAEIHELRDTAQEAHASLIERVQHLETTLSRVQGEDTAEARLEAHGHNWRQTILSGAMALGAGVVGAVATFMASGKH